MTKSKTEIKIRQETRFKDLKIKNSVKNKN